MLRAQRLPSLHGRFAAMGTYDPLIGGERPYSRPLTASPKPRVHRLSVEEERREGENASAPKIAPLLTRRLRDTAAE